jgi:hypothetical protein
VLPGTTPITDQKPAETDYKAEAEKLRSELQKFRKMEDQLKAMRPKAQKFDEMQQAALSAEERAQLAVETSQRERDEAKAEANATKRELEILRVGIKYKFDEEDLGFFEDIPAEKIEETAKRLAKRIGRADTPNFDGGSRTPPPTTDDMGIFLSHAIDRARGRR